jgi:hypothetical protein
MSHFTFVDVPDDEFEVPATRWERRRRIRRWVALAAAAAVATTLVGWAGAQLVTHRCRWLDFSLTKTGGECVGVTAEKAFVFDAANHDPAYADVIHKIADENQWVRDQWEQPDPRARRPYVRVALMMPMSSTPDSPLTPGVVLHSLQGAYTALYRANHRPGVRDNTPLVQLLLANIGSSQAQWRQVVAALAPMARQKHPLVAVVGLGVSIPETRLAAAELGKNGIPTVGAVLSGTDIVADRLFKVSPANPDYATALRQYLAAHPDLRRGFLVWDSSSEDNHVRTLREALEQRLSDYIQSRRAPYIGRLKRSEGETPVLFARSVDAICQTQPDVVFFAGRVRDLPDFIRSLAHRPCGTARRLTIMTGSASVSSIEETKGAIDDLKSGNIDLLYAASTDAASWVRGAGQPPNHFAAFYQVFHDELGFADASLRDGYAIMHHDAVLMAVWATRLVTEQEGGAATPENTFAMMQDLSHAAVPGASGTLSFDGQDKGWPTGKPVPVVRVPADGSAITPVHITRD